MLIDLMASLSVSTRCARPSIHSLMASAYVAANLAAFTARVRRTNSSTPEPASGDETYTGPLSGSGSIPLGYATQPSFLTACRQRSSASPPELLEATRAGLA